MVLLGIDALDQGGKGRLLFICLSFPVSVYPRRHVWTGAVLPFHLSQRLELLLSLVMQIGHPSKRESQPHLTSILRSGVHSTQIATYI